VLANLVAGIQDWKLMKRESPGMLTINPIGEAIDSDAVFLTVQTTSRA
jgi:hypothetical protein